MIKIFKIIGILIILPLLLTGCWDYKEVNKRDIIISIGVEDKNGNIQFTGESAKVISTSAQNKGIIGQITDVNKYKGLGNHFEESRADYDSKIPFPYFPGATRCIVFSKKFGEEGIESYINRAFNIVGFRNSVMAVISKETPEELFNKKVDNDICVGYAIEDTIRYLYDNGGALYKTVQQINSDIEFRSIGYFLPYVTVDKSTVKYLGLGVMKDSKLVGIVKREESSGFLFVLAKKPGMAGYIPHPSNEKNLLSIKTILDKRKIEAVYKDKKIHIYLNLSFKSQLQYEYDTEPLSKQDIKKLEETISNKIKVNILDATKRSQKEFKSDVFAFAKYFKADNLSIYKSINWKEEYPNAIIYVNVATTIANSILLDPNAKKND